MYKNQLQELAQRGSLNLPSYSSIREGPDHAPKFKSTVTFNGESFESPGFFNTLRQAEHAAAEVALNTLSMTGPTQSLAAHILDETGVCKNLLQETAQRAGASLPVYSVIRSGPGHMPVFVSTVEVAGLIFKGESAKTKKQAEKNAAMQAWATLKQHATQGSASFQLPSGYEEQLQISIGRILLKAMQEGNTALRTPEPQMVPRPVTNSRIRISPIEEFSGQETISPQMSATWTSGNANTDPSPEQRQGARSDIVSNESLHDSFSGSSFNSVPGNSTTVNRMMTSGSYGNVNGRASWVRIVTPNPGTDLQTTFDQFQQDDSQSGTSTIMINDSEDASSSDSGSSLMHPTDPSVLRSSNNGQSEGIISAGGRIKSTATSLAPPVRIHQRAPVCSALPYPSKPEEQGMNMIESATQQSFAGLNL